MHPDHPTTPKRNPYSAPESDVSTKPSPSQEWNDFTRRCVGKINFRWMLVGFVSLGLYRSISQTIILVSEDRLEGVFVALLELAVSVPVGLICAFVFSKLMVPIDCKVSTVADFLKTSNRMKWFYGQPLFVAFVAMLLVAAVHIGLAILPGFRDIPIWPPSAYVEAFASAAIATLVAYPVFKALCRWHRDILDRMASQN